MDLEDACRQCGKCREEAKGVAPVVHGKYYGGPEWSCYECVDFAGGSGTDGS